MFTNFLKPHEIAIIKSDYRTLLESPEAGSVTLFYEFAIRAEDGIDPVYKQSKSSLEQKRVDNVKCLQHFPSKQQMEKLPFGILQDGDCIFYFSDELNLAEPYLGFPVEGSTLYFVDSSGMHWQPIQDKLGPQIQQAIFVIGGAVQGQPVICRPKKTSQKK